MENKDIIEMWDDIDAIIVDAVVSIAWRAGHEVDPIDIEDKMYDNGLHADVRENIVAFLKNLGYEFAYPDYSDEE